MDVMQEKNDESDDVQGEDDGDVYAGVVGRVLESLQERRPLHRTAVASTHIKEHINLASRLADSVLRRFTCY